MTLGRYPLSIFCSRGARPSPESISGASRCWPANDTFNIDALVFGLWGLSLGARDTSLGAWGNSDGRQASDIRSWVAPRTQGVFVGAGGVSQDGKCEEAEWGWGCQGCRVVFKP